jgi:hypothetical protein
LALAKGTQYISWTISVIAPLSLNLMLLGDLYLFI